MPLTFRLSEEIAPKPRTYLTGHNGPKSVGGAYYPHNWFAGNPRPPFFWHWGFSIGPWKWKKPGGMVDAQEEAEARICEAYTAFLEKFGLEEGPGGAARKGSLTLRLLEPPIPNDFHILHSGEVMGRLRYPSAEPPRGA